MQLRPSKPCKPLPSTQPFTSSLSAAPFYMHSHINPIDFFYVALRLLGIVTEMTIQHSNTPKSFPVKGLTSPHCGNILSETGSIPASTDITASILIVAKARGVFAILALSKTLKKKVCQFRLKKYYNSETKSTILS